MSLLCGPDGAIGGNWWQTALFAARLTLEPEPAVLNFPSSALTRHVISCSSGGFLTLKPQSFATVAASEGGQVQVDCAGGRSRDVTKMTAGSFFAYLRSLGLLLIGYAEVAEDL